MSASLMRRLELAGGAAAVVLPLALSPRAVPLAVAGAVALAAVAWRKGAGARTVLGVTVVANAFVFPVSTTGVGLAVLVADAVALLVFLAAGSWVEAVPTATPSPRLLRSDGLRIGACVVVIALVALVGAGIHRPDLWIAVAGMVAAVGAVLLARTGPTDD